MAEFKVIDKGRSPIHSDQEGEFYFEIGETVYYLNEFMPPLRRWKHYNAEGEFGEGYEGVASISNVGGIGINIDEVDEYVNYTIFT
tara:strand:+ start:219 stop:476 length:258 start_codon:yes stop_codon:yes gene_type:complete